MGTEKIARIRLRREELPRARKRQLADTIMFDESVAENDNAGVFALVGTALAEKKARRYRTRRRVDTIMFD